MAAADTLIPSRKISRAWTMLLFSVPTETVQTFRTWFFAFRNNGQS
jgi:hypothetical protein